METGIQIASGSGADRRSTNQDMDNYFDKKAVWLDLGYIDYHPCSVPGLKIFAGKMKQPWMAIGDAAWDGDINPEGFAAGYTKKNGTTTFFGSAGYYVLKDNVDGEGVEIGQRPRPLPAAGRRRVRRAGSARWTLGASLYDFNKDQYGVEQPVVPSRNGNTTDQFGLYEIFGQLDVIGLPLPLSLYGQYVQNVRGARHGRDATIDDGDEDTAYLFGLRTNIAGIAFDYNYRDVERNGSWAASRIPISPSGFTDSSGHKLKLKYDFMKNFNRSRVTWFLAESDAASSHQADGRGRQTRSRRPRTRSSDRTALPARAGGAGFATARSNTSGVHVMKTISGSLKAAFGVAALCGGSCAPGRARPA